MTHAFLLAFQLMAAPAAIEIESQHTVVELDKRSYVHVTTDRPLRAQVKRRGKSQKLTVDVVRLGGLGLPESGAAELRVKIGGKETTIRVRPPLDASRKVLDSQPASYPVRHRFDLPAASSVVDIELISGKHGVLVYLGQSGRGSAQSVPLESVNPPDAAPPQSDAEALARAQAATAAVGDPERGTPEPRGAKPGSSAPTKSEPSANGGDASTSVTAAADPAAAAATPVDGAAASADSAASEASGATTTPADAPVAVDASSEEEASAPGAPPPPPASTLPFRAAAQVSAGGLWQVSGGLQPLLFSGGVRVNAGAAHGWLSRYAFGIALDFDQQGAASALPAARWTASATRFRVEAEARVMATDFGFGVVDVAVFGGAGLLVGRHDFAVGGKTQTGVMLGPTARVGLVAGLPLGPGSLTLLLPLDASVDTSGTAQGYAPLALGTQVGYRLDL